MDTLGVVECRTIASGVKVADGMVKVADVELVRAATICSGRYLIYVSGDRSAVAASVDHARESGNRLAGSFVISNISEQVLMALKKTLPVERGMALGVVEAKTVSAGIAAADSAVKRADITLARLVTGQGINGKSYFVMSGEVASVEEATATATLELGDRLIDSVVIPRPDVSVVRSLTSGVR